VVYHQALSDTTGIPVENLSYKEVFTESNDENTQDYKNLSIREKMEEYEMINSFDVKYGLDIALETINIMEKLHRKKSIITI